MSIGLEAFRAAKGDRLILEQGQGGQPTGVRKAELKFKDRAVHFFQHCTSYHGNPTDIQENQQFKVAFMQALIKAEGVEVAQRAWRRAGLPNNWAMTTKPMSAKQVKLVLDEAQQIRLNNLIQYNRTARSFLLQQGPNSFTGVFNNHNQGRLPNTDVNNPQLRALFARELKNDPAYGKERKTPQQMQAFMATVAQRAIDKFVQQKQTAFREQHPGLAQFVSGGQVVGVREDMRSFFDDIRPKLDPNQPVPHLLSTESQPFRDLVSDALDEIETTSDVLQRMEYDPDGWASLKNEIQDKREALEDLKAQLEVFATDLVLMGQGLQLSNSDAPTTQAGKDLLHGVIADLERQIELLDAQDDFIDAVAQNDPLSEKMVAYSNLLWAEAAGKIFDEAIAQLNDQALQLAQNPQTRGKADQLLSRIQALSRAKLAFIDMQRTNYETARTDLRTIDPESTEKNLHPATLGKSYAKDTLEAALKSAGFTKEQIKTFTSSETLGDARRKALNENQDWAPIQRDMLVTKDGVTRVYRSKITPGACINPRFARRYHQSGVQGVSSATKTDLEHARNLKVSELELVTTNGTVTKGRVIGHGVLDMWNVPDPTQRHQANVNGAHEVLEAAISTNDRVLTEALNRAQQKAQGGNPPPVKVTHVSVDLITPAGWRELPGARSTEKLHDYQEQTYTKAQFEAFKANSTEGNGGHPVQFQVDDVRNGPGVQNGGQDVNIDVDVDVISFSFGINPMATGKVPDFVGGWASVYDHNRTMMTKFVGDLGTGEFGAFGTRPGGFIGSVMDRLDPNVPQEAELLRKMQEQSDLVRSMFTNEDFKRGNGDPAKMGRHILVLQGLAEEALSMKNVTDQAATMSKGCKSDKDRGGVTDVEFKHQLITEDMGGLIIPDRRLRGDDQRNYYIVSVGSGQLENQKYNTGLPGSKEAGKLQHRLPQNIVRSLLKGLGKFASE